jgi:formate dehydrogenase iron-sulfur subunit
MGIRELELADLPQTSDPPVGPLAAIINRLTWPFRYGHVEPQPSTGFYTDTTVCIGCKSCEVACKQWNQLAADGLEWTGNSYDNTAELSATSWRHVKFIEQFAATGRPTGNGATAPAATTHELNLDQLLHPEATTHELTIDQLVNGSGAGRRAADSADTSHELTIDQLVNGGGAGRWLMMSDVCKHCVAAPCQHACPTGAIIYNEFANVYIQRDICNGCSYCIASCPFGVITRSDFDGHSHKCTLCYDRQKDGLVPACAKACPTESIQFGPIDELRERARNRVKELHARGVTGAYLYGDEPTETYSALHSFYLLIDHPAVYGLPDAPFNPWLHMLRDYGRTTVSALVTIAVILILLFLQGV